MSTRVTTQEICAGYEPIAGYTLEEKIGQGGFGEVWRADAPGGLKKAVKFVFGATDQTRGSRELKSLERIKGVHHPFLLTLERFGVVNDQLVIVTELADGSLEDIFRRHQDRGSCGIPRNALIAYLHDAADALDYLHTNYQLQHLDIKPGNLLVVGGHVKVGDFGLLKDLREADCSIVGGLTPIYAPPEVFDGRPSLHSDQYSMAVMYQELLTGTRPFSGRTIAQLATQHVHTAPNLESLPPGDRPLIARALEKNPDRRFSSCRELIEALRDCKTRSMQVGNRSSGSIGSDTLVVNLPMESPAAAEVKDLPQIEAPAAFGNARVTGHALVVAIGGVGAECLHELRSRVAKLHAACPLDLHAVLIDSDLQTINAARFAELSDRVPPCNRVFTPLKQPADYRGQVTDRFRSISRRWIYNVPRSGRTEGLRPLGRLAMVDHGGEIKNCLTESIDHLAAVCGSRTPHIYVVGSVSGGTCGGMVLDIVHLLRHLLDAAGLEQSEILSLLAATSLQPGSHHAIAQHDTQAVLREMRYFMQPENGYPGDAGAGFPSVPAARTPLHTTYLIADDDSRDRRVSPIETIIDYLWADSTGAGPLLSAARTADQNQRPEAGAFQRPTTFLRSVGVVRLGCFRALEENLLTPALVRHLLLRWLGRPSEAKQIATPLCDRLIRRCDVSTESLLAAVLASMSNDPTERRDLLLTQLRCLPATALSDAEAIDHFLASYLNEAINTSIGDTLIASVMVAMHREISVRLHDRRLDLTSAIAAVELFMQSCETITQELLDRKEVLAAQRAAHGLWQRSQQPDPPLNLIGSWSTSSSSTLTEQLEQACQLAQIELEHYACEVAGKLTTSLRQNVLVYHEQLEQQAARVANAIRLSTTDKGADENPWAEMPQDISMRFEPLLLKLHGIVANELLLGPLRTRGPRLAADDYVQAISQHAMPLVEDAVDANQEAEAGKRSATLEESKSTSTLPALARTQLLRSHDTASTQTVAVTPLTTRNPGRCGEQTTINAALDAARPALLECGGRQRLILLVGNEAERSLLEEKLRSAHGGALTVALIPGVTPMLIHEAQQIDINDVINRLGAIGGGNQVSDRLQSRSDIEWESGSLGPQQFGMSS